MQEYLDQAIAKVSELAALYGLRIIAAILIFFVGKWVARLISNLLRRLMDGRKVDGTLSGFLANLTYITLMVVVVIAALEKLGVDTGSFVVVVGAAGLAIGFALQGSLGNFAAGVMLIAFRPFSAGDLIEAAGTTGWVQEVQLFATVLKTADGKRIIVPNGAITAGNITNYTVEGQMRLDMVFGIDYGDDFRKAKEIVQRILDADDRVLKDPALTIAVSELGDSSVNIAVMPWIDPADRWPVWFDTHEAVKLAFDEAGISFPFPQQDVHMHQAA